MEYQQFLEQKHPTAHDNGMAIARDLIHPMLFNWQKDIVVWACRKGSCAVFLDTGLGKTFIQLEWARLLGENTLIIAPLSVARQTVREAQKIGVIVKYARNQDCVTAPGLWITNYEMADCFDYSQFGAIVLDESSILKSISGKTRVKLTQLCRNTRYKLCCTATPAPNDYIELGNHAEFLGVCKASEMLAMFFINANREHTIVVDGKAYYKKGTNKGGQEWRLKHHAEAPFFKWLASWAITMTKPSDLGYEDEGFALPPLKIHPIYIHSEYKSDDQLFFTHLRGITDRAKVRRSTLNGKLDVLQEIVSRHEGQWIIWCGLDDEARQAKAVLPNATEVKGADDIEYKVSTLEKFQDGLVPVLITKPKIAGFGMNFQNAHNMAFLGLSDSWETYYQCIRRQWRYGQDQPVNVYLILHDAEAGVYQNVMRKDAMAYRLKAKLIDQIKDYEKGELGLDMSIRVEYGTQDAQGDKWVAKMGDSCERLGEIPSDSIDLSVYSPPFADLFTYTSSERDLGNCKGWDEFFAHYHFIIGEMLRVTKSGRLSCVHTSDIAAMAQRDGYIGVKDFPGDVIRAHIAAGWVFHGRAFVQKNPQAQAIRTHSKGLLFVQIRKDSSDSRPALIDQILIFKKPGTSQVPVNPVANGELNNEMWIEWAHGIWLGISESDTLSYHGAREQNDEKHICPLQLGTIERCIKLYSNPGEMVLTPFGGIGSEAYMAVKLGRRATLLELKPEYFRVATENLRRIESLTGTDMFSGIDNVVNETN